MKMDKLIVQEDADDFETGERIVDSDDEGDDNDADEGHDRLMRAMRKMGAQKRSGRVERTEPALQVSEFASTPSAGQVQLHQLVAALKDEGQEDKQELRRRLRRVQAPGKLLQAPLPRHVVERMEREVAYMGNRKELAQWESVVEQNRVAEQVHFPLVQPKVSAYSDSKEVIGRFQARTPLELEVQKLLSNGKSDIKEEKMLTEEEEKALKAMSLEEALERRAALRKHRALLSYREAKARYQGKIKSKKYHKILKKERMKKEVKALEELQKTDPEAFLEKLESQDKTRIKERMSLKHRGSSKFMQKQSRFSKYNDEARQSVQDMLQKSRQLTEKKRVETDSESDEETGVEIVAEQEEAPAASASSANPWMKNSMKKAAYVKPQAVVSTSAIKESSKGKLKAEEGVNSRRVSDASKAVKNEVGLEEEADSEDEEEGDENEDEEDGKSDEEEEEACQKEEDSEDSVEEIDLDEMFDSIDMKHPPKKTKAEIHEESSDEEEKKQPQRSQKKHQGNAGLTETLVRKQKLEDFEGDWEGGNEEVEESSDVDEPAQEAKASAAEIKDSSEKAEEVSVDPGKFMTVDGALGGRVAPTVAEGEEGGEGKQRMTIAEAFASDDVIEEFHEEKRTIEEEDKPKDIDLSMPGWGDWGGAGVVKRSKKKFLIKAPPARPRKDAGLDNVIISEAKVNSIRKHQVSQLPHTYNNVATFESSIRHPLGKNWNPETAFQSLIKPNVTTKLGQVIDPIDSSAKFKEEKVKAKDMDHKRKRKAEAPPSKSKKKAR